MRQFPVLHGCFISDEQNDLMTLCENIIKLFQKVQTYGFSKLLEVHSFIASKGAITSGGVMLICLLLQTSLETLNFRLIACTVIVTQ